MFVCGMICGALIALCLVIVFCVVDIPEETAGQRVISEQEAHQRHQQKQENRNFLYYDGTDMPEKKEDNV